MKDYSIVDDSIKKVDLVTKMISNRKMSKKEINSLAHSAVFANIKKEDNRNLEERMRAPFLILR